MPPWVYKFQATLIFPLGRQEISSIGGLSSGTLRNSTSTIDRVVFVSKNPFLYIAAQSGDGTYANGNGLQSTRLAPRRSSIRNEGLFFWQNFC